MPLNTGLSQPANAVLLARIAHAFTICARGTYEVGTENVLAPQVLRAYNELLHRVTGGVRSHLMGQDGYTLESILGMMQAFGEKHNQAKEMEWAIQQSGQPLS